MKSFSFIFSTVILISFLLNCGNDNCDEYTVKSVELKENDTFGFPYSEIDTIGYYIQSEKLTDSIEFLRANRVQNYGPVRHIATEAMPVCYDQKDEYVLYEFSNNEHKLRLIFKSYLGHLSFRINAGREYSFRNHGPDYIATTDYQLKDSLATHAYREVMISSGDNVELLNHPTLGILSIADSSLETFIKRYK